MHEIRSTVLERLQESARPAVDIKGTAMNIDQSSSTFV